MVDPRPEGQRPCPICAEVMSVIDVGPVNLDTCPAHGTWLDRGEWEILEQESKKGTRKDLHGKMARARGRAFRAGLDAGRDPLLELLFGSSQVDHRRRRRLSKVRRNLDAVRAPKLDHDNDQFVPEGERACPVCSNLMTSEERKDLWGRTETVIVDVCADHGLWFDRSELEVLLDRSRHSARRAALSRRRRAVNEAYEEGRQRRRDVT